MKGLEGRMEFNDYLTSYQRETLGILAEVEKEDADRCAGCGGEDCICCEYYQDRQKWSSPNELFSHEIGDPMYDDYDMWRCCDCEEDEEWEE